MNDSVQRPEGESERRRAPRAALRLNATIREPGRSRIGVRIIDISTHGCRIEATSGASADTWVLLSIAGLETQYSRVVWQAHEFVGLEFANPMAEAVLDRFLQDQKQLSEIRRSANSAISPTGRIGWRPPSRMPTSDRWSTCRHKCAVDAVIEGLRLGERQAIGLTRRPRPAAVRARLSLSAEGSAQSHLRLRYARQASRAAGPFSAPRRGPLRAARLSASSHMPVEGELDDGLHRRTKLDLEPLRFDQPQIFLGLLFGIEREIIGRAQPLIEGDVAAHLRYRGPLRPARGLRSICCARVPPLIRRLSSLIGFLRLRRSSARETRLVPGTTVP